MQGAQRYLIFAYIVVGALAAATFAKLFSALAGLAGIPDPGLLGAALPPSTILGTILAAAGTVWLWKNERAHTFSHDVVAELNKVTWPSRKETQTATVVVIIATVISSVILGVFDALWSYLTGLIYS